MCGENSAIELFVSPPLGKVQLLLVSSQGAHKALVSTALLPSILVLFSTCCSRKGGGFNAKIVYIQVRPPQHDAPHLVHRGGAPILAGAGLSSAISFWCSCHHSMLCLSSSLPRPSLFPSKKPLCTMC